MKPRYRHDSDFYPKAEVSIWCAVIRNAIIEYRRDTTKYRNKYQNSRYRAWQMDAQHWLFRSSYRGPVSLIWICDLLGLKLSDVRKKALTCDLNDIAAWQRKQEARG